MKLLQIQTQLRNHTEDNNGTVIDVPVKGSLPLVEKCEIKLFLRQRGVGFYIGKRSIANSDVYYGDEFFFPDELPSFLFTNFSLPMTEFLDFYQEAVTGLVEQILNQFLKPELEILGYNGKVARVQFQCESISGERFKTVVEIEQHRLQEYVKKDREGVTS
jgi:hypothetical protein